MDSAMSIFKRIVLLFKVLVMLSVGLSAVAWAECPDHGEQASSGQGTHPSLMIAASETGGQDDDDSTPAEPDGDEDEGT
jgi:hypothetical protein